jgi:hypothetical protein
MHKRQSWRAKAAANSMLITASACVLQQGEEQPKCCAKARGFALERSVGRHVYSIVDPQGHPLDMDVVDTTFLDANIQVQT